VRFITFAVHYIRRFIKDHVDANSHCVRVPFSITPLIREYQSIRADNPDFTEQEIQAKMGVSDLIFRSISITLRNPQRLDRELNTLSTRPDALGDFLTTGTPDLPRSIKPSDILKLLNDREREVVERSYGFYGKQETLQEIGNTLGVSRERVRQIRVDAHNKLRRRHYRIVQAWQDEVQTTEGTPEIRVGQ